MPYECVRVSRTTGSAMGYLYTFPQGSGDLYGVCGDGTLWRWDGISYSMDLVADTPGNITNLNDLFQHNGELYVGGSGTNAGLFKWNGEYPAVSLGGAGAWELIAPKYGSEDLYAGLSFGGKIYCGTSPHGLLLEYNGAGGWNLAAPQLGTAYACDYLIEYEDDLYGMMADSLAKIYRWNGTNAWVSAATVPIIPSGTDLYSANLFRSGIATAGSSIGTSGRLWYWPGSGTPTSLNHPVVPFYPSARVHRTIHLDGRLVCTVEDGRVWVYPSLRAAGWPSVAGHQSWEHVGTMEGSVGLGAAMYRGGAYVSDDEGKLYILRREPLMREGTTDNNLTSSYIETPPGSLAFLREPEV